MHHHDIHSIDGEFSSKSSCGQAEFSRSCSLMAAIACFFFSYDQTCLRAKKRWVGGKNPLAGEHYSPAN